MAFAALQRRKTSGERRRRRQPPTRKSVPLTEGKVPPPPARLPEGKDGEAERPGRASPGERGKGRLCQHGRKKPNHQLGAQKEGKTAGTAGAEVLGRKGDVRQEAKRREEQQNPCGFGS